MNKKLDIKDIIFTSVIAVMFVLVLVSLFIPFVGAGMNAGGVTTELGTATLFELEEIWGILTIVFAILTLVTIIAALVLTALKGFGISFNKSKLIMQIVSGALILFAILTFVFGMVYGAVNSETTTVTGQTIGAVIYPVFGLYMLPTAGVIGGICGIFATAK